MSSSPMIHGARIRCLTASRITIASSVRPATRSQLAVAGLETTRESGAGRAPALPCGSSLAKAALVNRSLGREPFEVGVDHHLDEALDRHSGLPAELVARLRRVADEMVDLGRPQERRIGLHVLLGVELGMAERELCELADGVRLAGREHEVLGLVLLEHPPHPVDVLAGEAPVALAVEVAELEIGGEPELDAGDAVRDLPGHELEAAPRRLVVEQDPGDRVE